MFFDQIDYIIDELIHRDSANYTLNRASVIASIALHGRLRFAAAIIGRPENRRQLTLRQLRQVLSDNKFTPGLTDTVIRAAQNINRGSDTAVYRHLPRRRSIKRLFEHALKESGGVWPVGLARSGLEGSMATEKWLQTVEAKASRYVVSYRSSWLGWRREAIGILAIIDGDDLEDEADRWNLELRAAVGDLPSLAQNDLKIPLAEGAEIGWDYSRICQFRYFYVHPQYRRRRNGASLARSMLRLALRDSRLHGKFAMLGVLGDNNFTAAAVRLYDLEGGHYLGSYRDRGDDNEHLLHLYLF